MRSMRFEDYVVARDDNGQQLDEAGILDTVKGWFGGGLGRELGAAQSRAKTSAKEEKIDALRQLQAKAGAIKELKAEKTGSFNTLEQAEKEVTEAIMSLLSLPKTINDAYKIVLNEYEDKMGKISSMLRKTKMDAGDRQQVNDALDLTHQRVTSTADTIMKAADTGFKALPDVRETVNAFLRDVRQHLQRYFNQGIRANLPKVEKFRAREYTPAQFKPQTGPGSIGGLSGLGKTGT